MTLEEAWTILDANLEGYESFTVFGQRAVDRIALLERAVRYLAGNFGQTGEDPELDALIDELMESQEAQVKAE